MDEANTLAKEENFTTELGMDQISIHYLWHVLTLTHNPNTQYTHVQWTHRHQRGRVKESVKAYILEFHCVLISNMASLFRLNRIHSLIESRITLFQHFNKPEK